MKGSLDLLEVIVAERMHILASEADRPTVQALRKHLVPLVRGGLLERVTSESDPMGDETSFDALTRLINEATFLFVVWSRWSQDEFFRDLYRLAVARSVENNVPLAPIWVDATPQPWGLAGRAGIPWNRDDPRYTLASVSDPNPLFAEFARSYTGQLERKAGIVRRPTPYDR